MVELMSKSWTMELSGPTAKGAEGLTTGIRGFINPHLSDVLHADRDRRHEVDHALRQWRCLSATAHGRERMITHGAQQAPGAWA